MDLDEEPLHDEEPLDDDSRAPTITRSKNRKDVVEEIRRCFISQSIPFVIEPYLRPEVLRCCQVQVQRVGASRSD